MGRVIGIDAHNPSFESTTVFASRGSNFDQEEEEKKEEREREEVMNMTAGGHCEEEGVKGGGGGRGGGGRGGGERTTTTSKSAASGTETKKNKKESRHRSPSIPFLSSPSSSLPPSLPPPFYHGLCMRLARKYVAHVLHVQRMSSIGIDTPRVLGLNRLLVDFLERNNRSLLQSLTRAVDEGVVEGGADGGEGERLA
ncbi:hypothetical protein VYU27_008419 [Nannochloropsis oceanica]